jgi:hypothetical protein
MNVGCGACAGRFGTGPRTLCVRDVADLERLLKKRPRFDSIHIVAPLMLDERLHWERRLSTLYNECGCSAGAVALLCVLAASGVRALLQPALLRWQPIATVLLMCFAAAVAGKFIGITLSRQRLKAEVRLLGETLADACERQVKIRASLPLRPAGDAAHLPVDDRRAT